MSEYFEKLVEIKKRYELRDRDFKRGGFYMPDPYSIYDWDKIWTPIERNAWRYIRFLGLPFYPQFPVENYFIDFADPVKKIGIEIDGRAFHQNMSKDKSRQDKLESLGWRIFRIPGWMTFKDKDDYFCEFENQSDCYDEEEYREKFNEINGRFREETAEGIMKGIKEEFYLNPARADLETAAAQYDREHGNAVDVNLIPF